MAAHQAPPSLGFSRQEHWSGLPFPSPMHESEKWKWSRSVVFDSSQPCGLQPSRLLCPWDFPRKSTGVGCHCPLKRVQNSCVWKRSQYESGTWTVLNGRNRREDIFVWWEACLKVLPKKVDFLVLVCPYGENHQLSALVFSLMQLGCYYRPGYVMYRGWLT